jgi:hypothetical protein
MGKKSDANLYNMSMFALGSSILLVGMWAGNIMVNTHTFKERIKRLIFPSPVGLYRFNLPFKLSLNKVLKVMKTLKDFGLVAYQINPSKFGEIINERNIILESTHGCWGGSPYIRKNKI